MKRITMLFAGICVALATFAQTDSTKNESDTIQIGSIIIIKKGGKKTDEDNDSVKIVRRKSYTPSKISTNWWILDLGISQVNDKTNYPQAIAQGFLPAGANEEWFDQRNIKSTNVNIWVFMQRLSIIKNVVNLKYGLGIELNNYRYTENIRFQKTSFPLVAMDSVETKFKKNKLAADYATVPMMLNFNFNPRKKHGFGFSVGASVGYLYSSRQKTITDQFGKKKEHDDFDLEKWKISYIGELALGPVRLYGSYATKSMFKKALDQTPYNFGIRFSNL